MRLSLPLISIMPASQNATILATWRATTEPTITIAKMAEPGQMKLIVSTAQTAQTAKRQATMATAIYARLGRKSAQPHRHLCTKTLGRTASSAAQGHTQIRQAPAAACPVTKVPTQTKMDPNRARCVPWGGTPGHKALGLKNNASSARRESTARLLDPQVLRRASGVWSESFPTRQVNPNASPAQLASRRTRPFVSAPRFAQRESMACSMRTNRSLCVRTARGGDTVPRLGHLQMARVPRAPLDSTVLALAVYLSRAVVGSALPEHFQKLQELPIA
jgi:hypothetical protein